MIEISKKRLVELEKKETKLLALESGGVDNWEGYDFAMIPFCMKEELQTLLSECVEEVCIIGSETVDEPVGRGGGYSVSDNELEDMAQCIEKFAIEYNNIKNKYPV
jgi:hypothetical protein